MIDLKFLLDSHPSCLNSRATLRSCLMDMYPNERQSVNILVSIYECGIVNKLQSMSFLADIDIQKFVSQLEREYGISTRYANEGLQIWADAFSIPIGNTSQLEEASRIKPQDVYLLVDSSGVMHGNLMGITNSAIEEVIIGLIRKEKALGVPIRLRILQFGSEVKWQTDSLIDVSEYAFSILCGRGFCELGMAFQRLNKQLTEAYNLATLDRPPIIALIISGLPTDNYSKYYEELMNNEIFRIAKKAVFYVGNDVDEKLQQAFTWDNNLIYEIRELPVLLPIITGLNARPTSTKTKKPKADGLTFNVTDNEFIEWINKETQDFQVEPNQYAEAKGSTAHVVTMSDGDKGYLYFHHDNNKENYESENLGMVSAIEAVGFKDKSTALAIVACIGSYIDYKNRNFRLVDAVHQVVNTGSYTRSNMTAIRVSDRYAILASASSRYARRASQSI